MNQNTSRHSSISRYSRKMTTFGWAMWDPGTQPFQTLVITFVFSVYITSSHFGTENHTNIALAWSTSIAGFAIAALAPLSNHWAERTGRRVGTLKWMTWALALVSGLLFFVQASASYLMLGMILLGVGLVLADVSSSIYNALLHDVADDNRVGRLSGLGWGLGYIGGIVSLLLVYILWIKPDVGLFGVTSENGMNIRVSMVFGAAWILLMTIPTFVILKDNPRGKEPSIALPDGTAAESPQPRPMSITKGYQEIWHTIKRLWARYPYIVVFLIASALFRDGVNAIFQFGAPIASQTFGFSTSEVMVFGIAANLIAGVATMLAGWLDDRMGPKWVMKASLILILVSGIGLFFLHDSSKGVFWVMGMTMCIFVGPVQAASRSYLTRVCPEGAQGDVFGLYATTGKAVSFIAPMLFGLMVGLGGALTGSHNTQYFGILGIAVVLLVGLVVLLFVKEPAGAAKNGQKL